MRGILEEHLSVVIGILTAGAVICCFILSILNYNTKELENNAKVIEAQKAYVAAGLVQRVDVTGHIIWTTRQ